MYQDCFTGEILKSLENHVLAERNLILTNFDNKEWNFMVIYDKLILGGNMVIFSL